MSSVPRRIAQPLIGSHRCLKPRFLGAPGGSIGPDLPADGALAEAESRTWRGRDRAVPDPTESKPGITGRGWALEPGCPELAGGASGANTSESRTVRGRHPSVRGDDRSGRRPGRCGSRAAAAGPEMAPSSRIELVAEPETDVHDEPADAAELPETGAAHGPRPAHARDSAAMRRVDLRPAAHSPASRQPAVVLDEDIRRLTTLCTMAACAMEGLGLFTEWPKSDTRASREANVAFRRPGRRRLTFIRRFCFKTRHS